jgi:N utilization substance protein B
LSLLYEAETKDKTPAELLKELPVPPDPFAADLVTGVGDRLEQIDTLVAQHSIGWARASRPSRRAHGVVLPEAVELASSYSTEESGRFVNGVLSAIATEVR